MQNDDMRALLEEALQELDHARIFIDSRQRMNPVGVKMYDDFRQKISVELDKWKPVRA